MHGGIGGGFYSQGQPAIQNLIVRLSARFVVDVYTAAPPNPGFKPEGYRLRGVLTRRVPRLFRWGYLMIVFLVNHLGNRYGVVYGLWGYPAGVFAVALSRLTGIPGIIHLQGGDAVSLPRFRYGVFYHGLRAAVCRFFYNRAKRIIALSDFQAASLKDNGITQTPLVIPLGVDTRAFTFRRERFDRPVVRFLHVGNLTPIKGQDVMLETFSKIEARVPARLTVVGGDFSGGRIKERCISLGIESSVDFVGPQPHTAMPGFYHNADVLLHTSWYEGQGLVVAEAWACGTIVAGTAVGTLADLGDRCAIVAEPGDATALAEKVLQRIERPDEMAEIQDFARRWVEENDVHQTLEMIERVINEL